MLPITTATIRPLTNDTLTSNSTADGSSLLSPTRSTSSVTSFPESSVTSIKRSHEEECGSILQKLSSQFPEDDLEGALSVPSDDVRSGTLSARTSAEYGAGYF